jgi:hypothetical protein
VPDDTSTVGVWKYVASVLGTAVITLVGSWFAFGQNTVSKDDIEEFVHAVEENTAAVNEHTMLLRAHGITLENLQPIGD